MLGATVEGVEAEDGNAAPGVTKGSELLALVGGKLKVARSGAAILLGIGVEVGAETAGIVAGAAGGEGAQVALVGEFVLGGDAAVAGNQAAGGEGDLGEVVVDNVVAIEAADEELTVEEDAFGTREDDEEALATVAD